MAKKLTKKELRRMFPEENGWAYVDMRLVSPITVDSERRLAALILSGIAATPVELGYTWRSGNRLVMVCRRADLPPPRP